MSDPKPLSTPARRRWCLPPPMLGAALFAAGCAQLPGSQAMPRLKMPEAFATAESFQAAQSSWPAEQWWTAYGDVQRNALIDEALQDAPDLQVATRSRSACR
ncbi:MAG: hypothetical protein RJA36_2632 [Pseudomonadota bacterium]|jgi:outer membrane protein TolC